MVFYLTRIIFLIRVAKSGVKGIKVGNRGEYFLGVGISS
jgi:hypothetical protein